MEARSLARTWILAWACATGVCAQAHKTVFVITDAEGVAGVCRQEQTDPKDTEMRQLLTGEINAAVTGLLDDPSKVDEVVVWDGHDGSQTLSALTIHPRAKLMIGDLGVTMTLERGYLAVAFVGQHARANRKGGILAHSYSSLGIQTMLLNGKPVGEIETRAALAGAFDVPVIFLSGDQAAAEDLHAIVPGAEVAVVKEGFSNYACETLSAQAARDLIKDGATRALRKTGQIKPYKIDGPVTIQIEYTSRNAPGVDARLRSGAEIIDARTIRYYGKDFLEAWTRSQRP
jgi:D-amino peptidase